ncbi:MAG: flagellar filament capping protein FliD [Lachnospiraceae bacterium]|nr:flagellar filament capping protein FliD [Lachnospiraceae bacterium]
MAGTRLSGLMSGMDTESIISQLVEARQKKVDTVKKNQKKLDYKQNAWKDLNTKLKGLQTKYLSTMRFSSAYSKKTTKISDSSVASIITGDKATNSVQTLEVKQLAKTAYLTGGEVTNTSGKSGGHTALTTMSDLGINGSGKFKLTVGGESKNIEFTADTTISDVLNELKDAGLNANFDEKSQRFFVSAKNSGEASEFSIDATGLNSSKALSALGLMSDEQKAEAATKWNATNLKGNSSTKVKAQDAIIKLNDAEFKNSTNTFEINGLTITANKETKDGEKVTVTTQDDTDGIYDMVKKFLKEYNSIINEMDKLYNAEDSKLEPLTDDEKYALSDKEVEDWENKLKSSILRRDENLSSVSSGLREIMSSGISVGGKTLYLSDFGIEKLGYFNAPDNEKNAYHIDGDPDDGDTSGNADKLKSMIANDPSTVVDFFTKLSQNLYDKMTDMSKSVDGYRSFGSFFDDKKMKTEYTDFTSKIADMEKKLNDYEDKWYKKFSKMETAMAKMQSNTNAVTAMLGGSR